MIQSIFDAYTAEVRKIEDLAHRQQGIIDELRRENEGLLRLLSECLLTPEEESRGQK